MRCFCVLLLTAITLCISSGCVIFNEAHSILTAGQTVQGKQTDVIQRPEPIPGFDYTLIVETEGMHKGKYEPAEGCYLGARITADKRINGDISIFEEMTGKEHAIYAISTELGSEFPSNELLRCIALQKTPLLTVLPPKGPNPYDEALLAEFISDLSKYNIPVFIEFYPYSRQMGYGAESYKRFWRKVWLALSEQVPAAAIVWSADLKDMDYCIDYYPGNSYVDWVGMVITADITEDGLYDFRPAFDSFCAHFQTQKPIIITALSVSHFSTFNNTYYTAQCSDYISDFYNYTVYNQPRVKAIIYNDRNDLQLQSSKRRNNYLITDEEDILTAYSSTINDAWFKSHLNTEAVKSTILLRAPVNAAAVNGTFYIPEKGVMPFIPDNSPLFGAASADMMSQKCYTPDVIMSETDYVLTVDEDKKIVYMLLTE